MYRFILIITLSLFIKNANAQTYVPFPTGVDTAVWFVSYSYGPFDYGYYNIITSGDTIFDGKEYTKLHYGDNDGNPHAYYGAIREENKIIYLRDLISNHLLGSNNINSDTILFDFNVEVGDTVNWFHIQTGAMEVYSIDSVQVADGTYRKQFNFVHIHNGSIGLQAIEGIGSKFGFIYAPIIGGGGTSTYCYFLNGDFVWTSWFGTTESDCYTSTKQLKLNSNIKIFPNPTNDVLNINFENKEQRELIIFDQLGKVVLNEVSNETNIILNLKPLAKGFYILAIQTKEGRFTKKIIKK